MLNETALKNIEFMSRGPETRKDIKKKQAVRCGCDKQKPAHGEKSYHPIVRYLG